MILLLIVLSAPIITPHDVIPRFTDFAGTVIESQQAGRWSDPKTWKGGVAPGEGESARIAHTVSLDQSTPALDVIEVAEGGALVAQQFPATYLELHCVTLQILEGGSFQVGLSEQIPYREQFLIYLHEGADDSRNDPAQWGGGIICHGRIRLYGLPKAPYVRLAKDVFAGDSQIEVEGSASGWTDSDSIVLTDSGPWTKQGKKEPERCEVQRINGAVVSGKPIALIVPAVNDHRACMLGKTVFARPCIANITRNIRIKSVQPKGRRGHVAFLHRADVEICYAEFCDLGRTLIGTPSTLPADVVRNPDGSIKSRPANQIGRYPFHLHHVCRPNCNGRQFLAKGISIWQTCREGDFTTWPKWAMVVHDTSYGVIEQLVVARVNGGGIVFEDGTEVENTLTGSIVCDVRGSSMRPDYRQDKAHEGAGIWIRNPQNSLTNNVVCDCYNGVNYYLYYAGNALVPTGCCSEEKKSVNLNSVPIKRFESNELYRCSWSAVSYWWLGATSRKPNVFASPSILKDTDIWHSTVGLFGYDSSNVQHHDVQIVGHVDEVNSVGYKAEDYTTYAGALFNPSIQQCGVGISVPAVTEPLGKTEGLTPFRVIGGYLNNREGIVIGTPWTVGDARLLGGSEVLIDGVRFGDPTWLAPSAARSRINFNGAWGAGYPNHVATRRVVVKDYNGVTGDNFRLHSPLSAPEATCPATSNPDGKGIYWIVGAPESGFSNAQARETYGVSVHGALGRGEKRPGVVGVSEKTE